MILDKLKKITDICILVENVERTVEFYTEKLDFELRRRAEGFADFHAHGVTLAAWEIDHINRHTGVSNTRSPKHAHKACVAVELESPASVDELYKELSERGVNFCGAPASYEWNAHCAYFTDPDGTLWELYAWNTGGPDDYHKTDQER
tara:strand:- start:12224 stop:12667 length:444 start_codon:yes stop_codon:yes gene_type:complete